MHPKDDPYFVNLLEELFPKVQGPMPKQFSYLSLSLFFDAYRD